MPYIDELSRARLEKNGTPQTPGELNYLITKLVLSYIQTKGMNYQYINDILGALEGSKMELYRRLVIPYENQKLVENGDVYPKQMRRTR